MGIKKESGFTVIETMLFLAVSGMLVTVILVGSGVAIGQQRYRDSVNSLKSHLQQQYSETVNVTNDRGSNWTCNDGAAVSEVEGVGGVPRGTSNCVILGRFVTIDATGTKLSAANVIGMRQPGADEQASDLAELKENYTLRVSPVTPETTEVSWGAQVVKPKTATPMPFSLLIVRSPLSGSVVTFAAEGVQSDLNAMITTANMQQKDMCVNAEAGSFVGGRMAVRVAAYATNQGGIEIPPESEHVCD